MLTKNQARLILTKYHTNAHIGVDTINEHGSSWVVLYRAETKDYMHFRVAIIDSHNMITNNIIADQH